MSFDLKNLSKMDSSLLKLLTYHLPDMLWIKDVDGIYIYANKALCEGLLMAKDVDEVIGKDDVFFAQRERDLHKDNPQWHTFGELCFNSDIEVIKNKMPMKFLEFGNVKGELLYLEVNKAPFFDDNGNIIGTVGSGRDLTELKKTQFQLEKQIKIIENQAVHVSMGEMIANIAHQWRQPLSIISTASTSMIIEAEFDTLDKESLIHNCHAINNNAQYLSRTIDDFKDFINGDSDKSTFNLSDEINSFLNLIEGSAKSNNIKIILDLDDKIEIDGYKNELTQCLINIYNNAKDALVQKNTSNEDRYIFITTSIKLDEAIILIKDNAGGIPDNILPRIFEPYFTTKHKSKGTGLGLHMSHKLIVEGMNGTVEAYNTNYKYDNINCTGAEFKILIPII